MKLETLLNLWHLSQQDIELVEHLREPFLQGKEFIIEYSKKSPDDWWKAPIKTFDSDFLEKNFIKSFKSPFISSKDHIEITISKIKNQEILHQEISNNEEVIGKISELCNQFKNHKKFALKIKLVKPFLFDYYYSPTQVGSLLFLLINDFNFWTDDFKESFFQDLLDGINEIKLLEVASFIQLELENNNQIEESEMVKSLLKEKNLGIIIKFLDNLEK